MHRFHSLMKGAATSDCKLLLVQVPTNFFFMKFRLYKVFFWWPKSSWARFRAIMNQLFLVFLSSVLLASSVSIGSAPLACEQIHTSLCWRFTEGREKTLRAEVDRRSPPALPRMPRHGGRLALAAVSRGYWFIYTESQWVEELMCDATVWLKAVVLHRRHLLWLNVPQQKQLKSVEVVASFGVRFQQKREPAPSVTTD